MHCSRRLTQAADTRGRRGRPPGTQNQPSAKKPGPPAGSQRKPAGKKTGPAVGSTYAKKPGPLVGSQSQPGGKKRGPAVGSTYKADVINLAELDAMYEMYGPGSDYDPDDSDDDCDLRDFDELDAAARDEERAAREDRREEKRLRRSSKSKREVKDADEDEDDQESVSSDSESYSDSSEESYEEPKLPTRREVKERQQLWDKQKETIIQNERLRRQSRSLDVSANSRLKDPALAHLSGADAQYVLRKWYEHPGRLVRSHVNKQGAPKFRFIYCPIQTFLSALETTKSVIVPPFFGIAMKLGPEDEPKREALRRARRELEEEQRRVAEQRREALRADWARREREERERAMRCFIDRCNAQDEAFDQARRTQWRCLACGKDNDLLSAEAHRMDPPHLWPLETSCDSCATPKGEKRRPSVMSAAKKARWEKFDF